MIKIEPVLLEKIWGGTFLEKEFNFKKGSLNNIGEAWIISGYAKYPSKLNFENKEWTLDNLYQQRKVLFNNYHSPTFPLLVKLIDAKDDLSIQVHPNDLQAKQLENKLFGKSEAWYVLKPNQKSELIIGTNAKDENDFKLQFNKKNYQYLFPKVKIRKEQLLNIESGTLHAILADTVVYEIQQSSDLTYRLFDYNRLENGKERELHFDKGLKVLKYQPFINQEVNKIILKNEELSLELVLSNVYFQLKKLTLNTKTKQEISFEKNNNFLLVTILEGQVTINNLTLNKGESGIIFSFELEKNLHFNGTGIALIANPK